MTNPLCPKRRVALLLLLVGVVAVRKAGGKQKCFHEEIRSNVTFELVPRCYGNSRFGKRDFRYSIMPGNYSCRGPSGDLLRIPRFEGDFACDRACPSGHFLGLGDGDAQTPPELVCKECPANTFSVGGGKLIRRWRPELTGPLPDDVQESVSESDGFAAESEGVLPAEFTSTCYGFNSSAFQQGGSMVDAWVEGHLCQPWRPRSHGAHIFSGNNRHVPKIRSELHLRLRMVRPGKVWFSYSVNADHTPAASEACPWLNGDTGVVAQWKCVDKSFSNTSWGCNDRGGRQLCPSNFPRMCGQPNLCADRKAYCCSVDCAAFGGPRLCPASGGLQVLLCKNLRVRRCQPMPIRALPFKDRFYVSSQLSFTWASIDVPEGWAEIIFVYLRDGAVAGDDYAKIGEVGWQGTDVADTDCTACQPGKQSVAGSDRCSSCPLGEVYDQHSGQCRKCASNQYALPGMKSCIQRPVCKATDFEPVFSACTTEGKRNKHFQWLQPKVCIGGVKLPPPHSNVDCAPCQPGQHRQGAVCVNCPAGHYGQGGVDERCEICPAGSQAPPERLMGSFDQTLPEGFTTGCVGLCGSEGWRGRTFFIDSGAHHLAPSSSWLQFEVNMARPGGFRFLYSVVCDPLLARLDFTVDGRHVPLRVTCFNHTRPQQHAPSHDIVVPPIPGPNGVEAWHGVKLSAGRHILRWTFNRLRNTPHHRRKGITGRHGVGNGSGAHHHVDELDRGPGDDHEAMHAGLAGGATADIRQMDAAETNFVRIHRFAVVGVEAGDGGATTCVKCPPGHYSQESTARCLACPAGKTSNLQHGSTFCVPCPAGSFAPLEGSPHCRPCGNTSTDALMQHDKGGRRGSGGGGAVERRDKATAGAIACPCAYTDDSETSTWGTAVVNGTKQDVRMGGEEYDVSALSGMYGPLPLATRTLGPGTHPPPPDSQVGLYVGICTVLVGGHNSRTTSTVFHQPQSEAHVSGEGDFPQECVGAYACLATIKDGFQEPHPPPPQYAMPLGDDAIGPTVSAGGQQSFGPLPSFLRAHRIQYFVDSGGQRWRQGGGLTINLSMGGVCQKDGDGAGTSGVQYHQTRVYVVCDTRAGRGQPELLTHCGSEECASVAGECVHHVLWKTNLGCPKCRAESYSNVHSPCVGGMRDVSSQTLEECHGGLAPPEDRFGEPCKVHLQDMLSSEDKFALAVSFIMMFIMACVMYERLTTYKRLYSQYRNMRPGTREMTREPGVVVAADEPYEYDDEGDDQPVLVVAPGPSCATL